MNGKNPNNLIHCQSPYLLQHAYNPVDWYPWKDEVLSRAEKENKPILLSIGYSTCHWCHVMEHESFADESVARLMNRHFVCIKVDREERPDLDKIYITAISAMAGSAGWPLNVFLTPERLPFFGGTYFPPEARPGIPSWTEVLKTIAEHWADPGRQDKLKASGRHVQRTLERHLAWVPDQTRETGLSNTALDRLAAAYDPQAGGFSRAPKFPSPGILQFLAEMARKTINAALARMKASPEALPMMLIARLYADTPLVQVTIAGAPANAGTAAMISAARSPRFMGRAIAVVDSDAARQHLATQIPFVEQAAAPGDTPRAWVCINRSCRDPVDSPEALQATLETALAG
ncbi:MAG: DUF255 domain-containing protein [Desulfobacterales bacterium]|jgi:uncharacterized protein YyaL (SSP411 family)